MKTFLIDFGAYIACFLPRKVTQNYTLLMGCLKSVRARYAACYATACHGLVSCLIPARYHARSSGHDLLCWSLSLLTKQLAFYPPPQFLLRERDEVSAAAAAARNRGIFTPRAHRSDRTDNVV